MSFAHFPEQKNATQLLQRSLERARLAHAYLFNGGDLFELEAVARTLAKTLCCENPPRVGTSSLALDCCDRCFSCRKIDGQNHPDILWVRPESKSRIIRVEQMREVMHTMHLKPTQARFKVAIVVAAERLKAEGANAFLKTLEEPPADSIVILLSTEPAQLLETIVSRCLRLNFAGDARARTEPAVLAWLEQFSASASAENKSLLGRYRLLSLLLTRLAEMKASIEETLTKSSPLERHTDVEPALREQWEDELTAAIEAEYRRQRTDLMGALQWWLRDVWLETLRMSRDLLTYPQLAKSGQAVAQRVTPDQAMENLRLLEETQRLLMSNVQEALALEVGLLRLKL